MLHYKRHINSTAHNDPPGKMSAALRGFRHVRRWVCRREEPVRLPFRDGPRRDPLRARLRKLRLVSKGLARARVQPKPSRGERGTRGEGQHRLRRPEAAEEH